MTRPTMFLALALDALEQRAEKAEAERDKYAEALRAVKHVYDTTMDMYDVYRIADAALSTPALVPVGVPVIPEETP